MLLFNNQSRFLSTGKLQNLTSLYAVHTFLYNEHHGGMHHEGFTGTPIY